MEIKAKVVCVSTTNHVSQQTVNFQAVTTGSEENKTFSVFTPALNLEMVITNTDAMTAFVPGQEYYLNFTPAN